MQSTEIKIPQQSRLKPRLISLISWGLFLIVVVFVFWRGKTLLGDQRIDWTSIKPFWLFISILLYAISLVPQAWYFFRLIQSAKFQPDFLVALQAHITGHLGKYVPGKTMVVLIRAGLLKREGVPFLTTVWAAMLETLLFMAVGTLLGLMSFPYLLDNIEPTRWQNWLGASLSGYLLQILPYKKQLVIGIVLLALLIVPLLTPLLDKIANKLSQKKTTNIHDEEEIVEEVTKCDVKHIRQLDVWRGIGWESLSWMFQCLSLVTVIFAWGVYAQTPVDYFTWGSIVVVTTVLGFLAFFTPGGLGVKDALLMELLLLTSPVTKSQAVAIALSHRVITLAGELIFSGLLWCITPKASRKI